MVDTNVHSHTLSHRINTNTIYRCKSHCEISGDPAWRRRTINDSCRRMRTGNSSNLKIVVMSLLLLPSALQKVWAGSLFPGIQLSAITFGHAINLYKSWRPKLYYRLPTLLAVRRGACNVWHNNWPTWTTWTTANMILSSYLQLLVRPAPAHLHHVDRFCEWRLIALDR